jgi:hypothetical protein
MTLNNHAPAIVLISPKSKTDRPPAKQKRKGQPKLTLSLFLDVPDGLLFARSVFCQLAPV